MKKNILQLALFFTIGLITIPQNTKAAEKMKDPEKCTNLIFWYDSPEYPITDKFEEASMWYTPCGASGEGPTKVFNHDRSNASTPIEEGSLVRIGVKGSAISKFKGNLSGETVYVKCSFYKENEGGSEWEINTCTQAGPPPWGTSHSSKPKK